jgi:uncharacterized protein
MIRENISPKKCTDCEEELMYRRKVMDKLLEWMNKKDKKSLIIEGARQVGKTYIVHEFANQYYGAEKYIYINFELDAQKKLIFENDLTAEGIRGKLGLLYRDIIRQNKILLFLDEIQVCPQAITALKSLTIDGRMDVIASGSLLGVHYNHVSSFPVGYVERIKMVSMDFEEFLWARGIDPNTIAELKKNYQDKTQVSPFLHQEMMKLFTEYIVVGGMPEVVDAFIKTKDFDIVLKNQERILDDYRSDIAKYASGNEKARARECFESIPFQLGKDNKKFQYKYVSKGGRSAIYDSGIQWLIDAGIALKCNNIIKPEIPLVSYKRIDAFKLYVSDIGLLVSMLGMEAQTKILFGELGISKGAIFENAIACLLAQNGHELYYYEKNTTLEIDFIVVIDHLVTGIEVKSADNTQSKSLYSFLEFHGGDQGIKLSSKNLSFHDKELRIPLYMTIFL